jgi:hypothetical protein
MHTIEESKNAPLNMYSTFTTKIINGKEEYDDNLDDGPILPKNPPCSEISTNLYEDKSDELADCDNTFTNKSHTLFFEFS